MTTVRRLARPEPKSIPALVELLQDAVHGGASVGFLAPLAPKTAADYWAGVFAGLDAGHLLWVAETAGRIVGSVQLELCAKENGRHRAEVQKLFVLRSQRGQRVSSLLLNAVDEFAAHDGRTLLVLDTISGSFAETVYRHHGWKFAGSIPDYAAMPDGELRPTSYFYKRLSTLSEHEHE
jgi:acetyltransferase